MASIRTAWMWLFALVALPACQQAEEIATYTVPKVATPRRTTDSNAKLTSGRMLGAIVTAGDANWFFKVTGPAEAVGQIQAPLREILSALRFDGDTPRWTLPAGWTERGREGIRFATLTTSGSPPLEVSVTTLPAGASAADDQLLANVNRWRGQLGLADLDKNQLADLERIDTPAGRVVWVDIEGTVQAGATPPFAGTTASAAAKPAASGANAAGDRTSGSSSNSPAAPIFQNVPPEWRPAKNDRISMAAYEVSDGSRELKITIGALAASEGTGDLALNINRWRAQVDMPELPNEEISQATTAIESGGKPGHYVELFGPVQAILGAIVPSGSQIWFFKARGDADLARREAAHFREFVSSQKLP